MLWVLGPQTRTLELEITFTLWYVFETCGNMQMLTMVDQDEGVNPSTYKTLDQPGYWGVHAIGEVWAEILWVVSQKLIQKHGYSDDLFPPAPLEDGTVPHGDFYRTDVTSKLLVPKHGNSLMVQ
jgi:hypothetical protein